MSLKKIIATAALTATAVGAAIAIPQAANAATNSAKTCATYVHGMGPAKVVVNKFTTSCALAKNAAKRMPGDTRGRTLSFKAYSSVTHKTYKLKVRFVSTSHYAYYYITGANGIQISVTQP